MPTKAAATKTAVAMCFIHSLPAVSPAVCRGMPVGVREANEPQQHHRSGSEHRRRPGNCLTYERPPLFIRVQLAFELDVAVVVKADPHDSERDENGHQRLQR